MAVIDPVGDMLTRIRNAQLRRKTSVTTPGSKLRARVLDVLQSEGYIRGYTTTEYEAGRTEFEIVRPALALHEFDRLARNGQRFANPTGGGHLLHLAREGGNSVRHLSTCSAATCEHERRQHHENEDAAMHRLPSSSSGWQCDRHIWLKQGAAAPLPALPPRTPHQVRLKFPFLLIKISLGL